jgi:hypothetical protein
MPDPKLHLDMDTSSKVLYKALLERGFDVTRTPNNEVEQESSDEFQLLWATSHQRIIFTFNIQDFVPLAKKHPRHCGIIFASQSSTSLSQSIYALSRMLTETSVDDWTGQIRWLNDWIN